MRSSFSSNVFVNALVIVPDGAIASTNGIGARVTPYLSTIFFSAGLVIWIETKTATSAILATAGFKLPHALSVADSYLSRRRGRHTCWPAAAWSMASWVWLTPAVDWSVADGVAATRSCAVATATVSKQINNWQSLR